MKVSIVGATGLSRVGAIRLALVGAKAASPVGAIALSHVGARRLTRVGVSVGLGPRNGMKVSIVDAMELTRAGAKGVDVGADR
jgi:hypothetical protein